MITLRIPTKDPYAYLEVQFDGGAEEAVAEYHRVTALVAGKPGMEPKEFNAVLDAYLTNNKIQGDPGMFEIMSQEQIGIMQAIKRSRARTNK